MKESILTLIFISGVAAAFGQVKVHSSVDSGRHKMGMIADNPLQKPDTMVHHHTMMASSFSKNLPMNRNGSGTGWLPDASPMEGYMFHSDKWMYMLHGNLFLRYTNQNFSNEGKRGDDKFDAPNWLMFMGQREIGKKGLFHFSTMISLDPLTVGGEGYPLLFQSGETWKGKPLIDQQHPHDLFSELSVGYSQELSKKLDVFLYLGYPGEPALGPVAFMHRPSALANPDAPISHHWIDATHVTFGVATLGVRLGKFKIEGSSFTGKEPNENRYNFDKPRFDSYSGRLSFNPSDNWALQVSHAFIKEPETLHSGNVNRTTASAIYSVPVNAKSSFNATAVWGLNAIDHGTASNAFLLEGEWKSGKTALYGRYDFAEKSGEELVLDEAAYHDRLFSVNALTLGLNYDLFKIGKSHVAGGGQFMFYKSHKDLDSYYGKNPMGVEIFLRLYPGKM
ncbi:MAG: hypothetical protein ABIN48_00345 [Ginsengibacter sp.]